MEIPTPAHELPGNMGGRFLLLVVLFVSVILGLIFVFVPNFNAGYGTMVFVGSVSIVLAILVNTVWTRMTDKEDDDD
jgi:uncharacterized membrane protein